MDGRFPENIAPIETACESGMTLLSAGCVDLLITAGGLLEGRVQHIAHRKIGDLLGALRHVLDLGAPGWAVRLPALSEFGADLLDELHAWLVQCRAVHPRSKAQTSRVREALRIVGFEMRDARGRLPLLPEWTSLLGRLGKKEREILLPLAHSASDQRVPPQVLTSQHAAEFARQHQIGRDTKSAKQIVRKIVATWNAIATANGLACLECPLPYVDRGRYSHPLGTFSDAVSKRLVHAAAIWRSDRRASSEKQIERRLKAIVQTLSAFCRASASQASDIADLDIIFDTDNLKIALEYMIGRAQVSRPHLTRTDGSYFCARIVREAARALLPFDDPRLLEMDRIVTTLSSEGSTATVDGDTGRSRRHHTATPRLLSRRKQNAVQAVIDKSYAKQFRATPSTIYREVEIENADRTDLTRLMYACALELMMVTGALPHEVAGLDLEADVQLIRGESGECYRIKMKNGKTTDLHGRSAEILGQYISGVRPRRPQSNSTKLLPGKNGLGCRASTLGTNIIKLIRREPQNRMTAKDVRCAIAAILTIHRDGDESEAIAAKYLGRDRNLSDPMFNTFRAWKLAIQADSYGGSTRA